MNLLVDYRIEGQLYRSTVGQDIYDRPPNTNLWKTVGQEIYIVHLTTNLWKTVDWGCLIGG